MSIESDLRAQWKKNNHVLLLTEVDDLIAVWRYKKCNRFTRSVNFSNVPEQWRYAVPRTSKSALIPCHITYRLERSHAYSEVHPAPDARFATACQSLGAAGREIPSMTELDAVDFAKRNVAHTYLPFSMPAPWRLSAGTLA